MDYTETTRVARDELRQYARPELADSVENMDSYDVIYLDYPNWWNTFPMPVFYPDWLLLAALLPVQKR